MATKYVSLDNLKLYDEKIKAKIESDDAAVLEQAKKYTDDAGALYEAAGSVATAKEELQGKIDAVDAKADANATAVEKAQKTADDVTALVGVLPEDAGVETVVAYVDAKTEGIASDEALTNLTNRVKTIEDDYLVEADKTELSDAIGAEEERAMAAEKVNSDAIAALAGKVGTVEEGKTVVGMIGDVSAAVDAHKEAIDAKVTTLVGTDTGKSVRTIANEELAAQLIGEGAKENLDTLQEIAQWIQSHPDDASAMNKAIEDLEALVGTLPEGVTATTIVGYIAEAVGAEQTRAEGIESGLDERLQAVETAVGAGGAVETKIANAIAELDADVTSAAVESGKGVQVQVVEVDGKLTSVAVTGNYDNAYDAKGSAGNAKAEAIAAAETDATTKANAAEANAIAHANTELAKDRTRLDSVESLSAANKTATETNATEIAKKAAQADLNDAVARIEAVEEGLESIQEADNSDIEDLFK